MWLFVWFGSEASKVLSILNNSFHAVIREFAIPLQFLPSQAEEDIKLKFFRLNEFKFYEKQAREAGIVLKVGLDLKTYKHLMLINILQNFTRQNNEALQGQILRQIRMNFR